MGRHRRTRTGKQGASGLGLPVARASEVHRVQHHGRSESHHSRHPRSKVVTASIPWNKTLKLKSGWTRTISPRRSGVMITRRVVHQRWRNSLHGPLRRLPNHPLAQTSKRRHLRLTIRKELSWLNGMVIRLRRRTTTQPSLSSTVVIVVNT